MILEMVRGPDPSITKDGVQATLCNVKQVKAGAAGSADPWVTVTAPRSNGWRSRAQAQVLESGLTWFSFQPTGGNTYPVTSDKLPNLS